VGVVVDFGLEVVEEEVVVVELVVQVNWDLVANDLEDYLRIQLAIFVEHLHCYVSCYRQVVYDQRCSNYVASFNYHVNL
jgi:hypothetical protein